MEEEEGWIVWAMTQNGLSIAAALLSSWLGVELEEEEECRAGSGTSSSHALPSLWPCWHLYLWASLSLYARGCAWQAGSQFPFKTAGKYHASFPGMVAHLLALGRVLCILGMEC